jgi:hypothetical protein
MRTIKGWLNGNGSGRAGFIYGREEEPYVGEQFLIPVEVGKPLKIHTEVAVVTGYCVYGNVRAEQRWWALYLNPMIENPCDEEFMKDISS